MTENVNAAKAVKSRKTKLNNKSKEDLIAIILRKDDVEKKQLKKMTEAKQNLSKAIAEIDVLENKLLKTNEDLREFDNKFHRCYSENTNYANRLTSLQVKNQELTKDKERIQIDNFNLNEKLEAMKDVVFKKNATIAIITIIAALAIITLALI